MVSPGRRFARRARLTGFGMFVEDLRPGAEHCLAREVRRATVRRAMALIQGQWQPLTVGHLTTWSTDSKNPGTPTCANVGARARPGGLGVVIGGDAVSDPNGPTQVRISPLSRETRQSRG